MKNFELNYLFAGILSLVLCCACGEVDFLLDGIDESKYSSDRIFYKEKDMSYILERTDDGQVLFSEDTPSKMLPKVGKVIAFPLDDAYPFGYFGKVKKIIQKTNGYQVELEEGDLGDLYPDTVISIKGSIYMMNDSRALDDITFDLNMSKKHYSLEGNYKLVAPDIIYDVETKDGEVIRRNFQINGGISAETEIKFASISGGDESEPLVEKQLWGPSVGDYFRLGILGIVTGFWEGEAEVDLAVKHVMEGEFKAGFDWSETNSDGFSNYTSTCNELEFSVLKKCSGELVGGIILKCTPFINYKKWFKNEYGGGDLRKNLYASLKLGLGARAKFDLINWEEKEKDRYLSLFLKIAGYAKASIGGKKEFDNGWDADAELGYIYRDSTYLDIVKWAIWPEFEITDCYNMGNSAFISLQKKSERTILNPNLYLRVRDKETGADLGERLVTFTNDIIYDYTLMLSDDYFNRIFEVTPVAEFLENQYWSVGDKYIINNKPVHIPGNDFVLP